MTNETEGKTELVVTVAISLIALGGLLVSAMTKLPEVCRDACHSRQVKTCSWTMVECAETEAKSVEE